MEHKYVRHSIAGFFVWPVATGQVWHKHIKSAIERGTEGEGQFISAGMCEIRGGFVRCYGESESTGIRSQPGDTKALAEQLGLKYKL